MDILLDVESIIGVVSNMLKIFKNVEWTNDIIFSIYQCYLHIIYIYCRCKSVRKLVRLIFIFLNVSVTMFKLDKKFPEMYFFYLNKFLLQKKESKMKDKCNWSMLIFYAWMMCTTCGKIVGLFIRWLSFESSIVKLSSIFCRLIFNLNIFKCKSTFNINYNF